MTGVQTCALPIFLTKLFSDPDFANYNELPALGNLLYDDGRLNTYQVGELLDFSSFGGYRRAQPSPNVKETLENRIKKLVHKAFADNNFFGANIRFPADTLRVNVTFDGKDYVADAATIKSANKITVVNTSDNPVEMPDVTNLNELMINRGFVAAPNLEKVSKVTMLGSRTKLTQLTVAPSAVINDLRFFGEYGGFLLHGAKTVNNLYTPLGDVKVRLPDVKFVRVVPLQGDDVFNDSKTRLSEYLRSTVRNEDPNASFGILRVPHEQLSLEGKKAFKKGMREIGAVFGMRFFNIESESYFDADETPSEIFNKFFEEYAGDYVADDFFVFNKRANAALDNSAFLTGPLIEKAGVIETPSKIGDTPGIQALTETDEQPVFARAQADGMATALNTAKQMIASPKTIRERDRKSTRLNSSHIPLSRMPSSA